MANRKQRVRPRKVQPKLSRSQAVAHELTISSSLTTYAIARREKAYKAAQKHQRAAADAGRRLEDTIAYLTEYLASLVAREADLDPKVYTDLLRISFRLRATLKAKLKKVEADLAALRVAFSVGV